MADYGGEFQVAVGCLLDPPTCFLPIKEEGARTDGVGAGSCGVCVCGGGAVREVEIVLGGKDVAIVVAVVGS